MKYYKTDYGRLVNLEMCNAIYVYGLDDGTFSVKGTLNILDQEGEIVYWILTKPHKSLQEAEARLQMIHEWILSQ